MEGRRRTRGRAELFFGVASLCVSLFLHLSLSLSLSVCVHSSSRALGNRTLYEPGVCSSLCSEESHRDCCQAAKASGENGDEQRRPRGAREM